VGLLLGSEGEVRDVVPGSAADKAGFAPGMKIKTVNGLEFSDVNMRKAVAGAKNNTAPIVVFAANGGFDQIYNLNYHDGEKYPHLVRDDAKPDLLSDVIKSR
jgi:C-terminal processing protease CtpA/Prc